MSDADDELEFEIFEEVFDKDIESLFSADIVCCDKCHDEFVQLWPYVEAVDNGAFWGECMDLHSFYELSRRIKLHYTRDQFFEYVSRFRCPRCEQELGPNLWTSSFKHSIDPDLEQSIVEIARIAESTPFLILKHPFASETYDLIQQVGAALVTSEVVGHLFRARANGERAFEELIDFGSPPAIATKEGRYNHAGNPVLYLASDPYTCFQEMRKTACTIADLEMNTSLKILDLVSPDDSHKEHAQQLSTLAFSALMSAKQPETGWHKPKYIFSRFVADCAKSAGIQAIKYPSTRITRDNFNLVILDRTFQLTDHAKLHSVIRSETLNS